MPAIEETAAFSRKVTAKASELEADLRQQLRRRWQQGDTIRVEEYLEQYPALSNNPDLLLELIHDEVRSRRERGANPQVSEYLERFPDRQEAIRRLFERSPVPASQWDQANLENWGEESEVAPNEDGTLVPSQLRKRPAELVQTASHSPGGEDREDHDVSNRPDLIAFLAPPQEAGELGRLGPYRVLEVLGFGAMGVVYRAEDPDLHRFVALKAMLPALAGDPASRKRFVREAQAAAAVEHDNVVSIYQVGEDRGVPFLAMPLLKGESLEARLHRQEKLPALEAVRIVREMAEGLQAAHEQGLIHRDVKPSNVWLEEMRGRVKLLDFGLARGTDGSLDVTLKGDIVGTPLYMSPEQGLGQEVDARCDLYSLGCVLYRALTGTVPFTGTNAIAVLHAKLSTEPVRIEQLNPEIPPELAELVHRLLAKNRENRPGSAREVAEALQTLAEMLKSGHTSSTHKPPSRLWRRVGWAAVLLLGAGIVVLACWLFPRIPGIKELRELVFGSQQVIPPTKSAKKDDPREKPPIPEPDPRQVRPPVLPANPEPKKQAPVEPRVPENTAAAHPKPLPKKSERLILFDHPLPPTEAEIAYRRGMELLRGIDATIDEAEAVRCFLQAEKKGHPLAKGQLALCRHLGMGVVREEEEAKRLAAAALVEIQKAPHQNNSDAQEILGSFYFHGLGVPQDYGQAANWYQKASAKGNDQAMHNLARMYEDGQGVEKDEAKAFGLYEKAAKQGNARAMNSLGVMNEQGGRGVEKDEAKAVDCYRQAADKGYAPAMNNLGVMYVKGVGVGKKDLAQAFVWFKKAAAKENVKAMKHLGVMYEGDYGVKDEEQSFYWFHEAARRGDPEAMRQVGGMYHNGEGVPRDEEKAFEWYTEAAKKGDPPAMTQLGWMYETETGVQLDLKKAFDWYNDAAKKGDPQAMRYLGRMYEEGRGVQLNKSKAREWYRKARDKGDKFARERLKELEPPE